MSLQFDQKLRRSRFWFHGMISGFVVITCFSFGFMSTAYKKFSEAHAYKLAEIYDPARGDWKTSANMPIPEGVVISPMGRDITVNGKDREMVMFQTGRKVLPIVHEQAQKWERAGYRVVKAGTSRRAIAIAIDLVTGERFAFSAWTVPGVIRRFVSEGYPVQGLISYDGDMHALPKREADGRGQVPGVPIPPGGKGGAVFSSLDQVGRAFTGVYTNPGTVDYNIQYYRDELNAEGWKVVGHGTSDEIARNTGHLTLRRKRKELTLLFTRHPFEATSEIKTVVNVILTPLL